MMKTLKIQLQSPDHVDKYIRAQESHSPQIIPILRGELLTDPVAGRTDGRTELFKINETLCNQKGHYNRLLPPRHATIRRAADLSISDRLPGMIYFWAS